jgi:hypothetical protein
MHAMTRTTDQRLMLWIDAVGAFQVCLGESVVLGQPAPDAEPRRRGPDVAILGDLHARHARITRDGEGYLIEAFHPVAVDGRPVDRAAPLRDGSEITLGRNVRLRLRRPHALSGTARLEPLSRHRIVPTADAVLLMAETCVLGPKPTSHVACPGWPKEIVLNRRNLKPDARIEGEGYSMTIERIL